jgi:hypothetical protein
MLCIAAVIFVIDVMDTERLPEVQGELVKLLSENELHEAVLLILANKQVCKCTHIMDNL